MKDILNDGDYANWDVTSKYLDFLSDKMNVKSDNVPFLFTTQNKYKPEGIIYK